MIRDAPVLLVCLLALAACSEARDSPRIGSDAQSPTVDAALTVDSLVAEGQRLYDLGEYTEAQTVWRAALDGARLRDDPRNEARASTSLGLAAWRLGDYAEARELGEAAIAIEQRHALNSLLPRSYNALGLLAWYEGRLTEAAQLYAKTTGAARAVGDLEYLGKAANNLGLVYFDFGELANAREGFLTARAAGRERGDGRAEGDALTNLGMLEIRTGDPRAAIATLEDALHVYRATQYRTGEEAALGQLATAYLAIGEPSLAVAILDSALAIARDVRLRREEAANLQSLADVHRGAGNLRRALQLYGEARAINAELGLIDEAAAQLTREAEIHAELGNVTLATRRATEALETHQSIGARFAELSDQLLLTELAADGDDGDAGASLGAARKLAADLGVRSARIDVAVTEARVADRRGDSRGVLAALDGIVDEVAAAGYGTEWEVQALRARAHARTGDLMKAAAAGRRAVAAIERVRSNYGGAALRTSYLADKGRVYSDLVWVFLELGQTADAFAIADAARGRALLEHLAYAQPKAGAPASATRKRSALLQRIERLNSSIREYQEFDDITAVNELERLLEEARRDYELLMVGEAARQGASAGAPRVPGSDVEVIRVALQPGEAIVEYLLGPNRLFTFVVTRTDVRTYTSTVPAASVEERVRLARDLLADPSSSPEEARAVLNALYESLLGEVLSSGHYASIDHLIIVPHAALTYLPFAALWNGESGQYLAEEYSLSFLPSAASLPALRSFEGAGGTRDGPAYRVAAFAPVTRELPASRVEAETVRRTLGGELYLGRRATEDALRNALSRNQIVHVASHAVMNIRNPMFSRIEMAAGNALEIHEVLALTIRSPLIFLSGCETGLGRAWSTTFAQGEDYATLERAFLYSGARSVVATLWQVEDAGSVEFVKGFYDRLEDLGPADALVQTQRRMMRHPRYAHPYFWAAYRLSGGG